MDCGSVLLVRMTNLQPFRGQSRQTTSVVQTGDISKQPHCAYQLFDPNTLRPLSSETALRIADLEPIMGLVAGRTVLDIGCNGGLVSAMSVRAGARRVLATDVDQTFVDATRSILVACPDSTEVRHLAFDQLGERERSDVTFFLEVYHWLVQQGMSPEAVVDILDSVTAETLVLEAPWDHSDPSVTASLTNVHYELPPLLKGLLERGFRVELRGFASYFPVEYRRGLFVCTRNR